MPRLGLDIPPGMKRLATPQATGKSWWDMSQVRWNGAVLQPIGGWARLPWLATTDGSAVRNLLSWRDNLANRWLCCASLSQVLVSNGVTLYPIAPNDWQPGAPGDLIAGYGVGLFGVGLYGTPRIPDPAFNPLGAPGDTVSLANWGENLVVCGSADGRILWIAPANIGTSALVPIPPAPASPTESPGIVHVVPSAQFVFVTDERFLVALGADHDPRRVAWSDQERPGAWTPDITNLCGSLQLNSTGVARAARKVPQGYLIWCDDDVHLMTWAGPPYAYGIVRVGTGCSAIGPQAMVATSQRTVWMGQESFWRWDGVPVPLQCDLQELVFGGLNRDTQGRCVGAQNGRYPEIWWWYPDQTSVEPNRYVFWNYELNIWGAGAMARTAATEPAAYGLPLCGAADGSVYAHEAGWLADGVQRGSDVYAETGDIQLGEGDQGVCIRAIVPDFGRQEQAQFHLFGQWEPEDLLEDWGEFPVTRTDGLVDVMAEARAIRLRIEGVNQPTGALVAPWTLGRIRLDVVPGSGR